jgi:hypothetical protein
VMSNDEMDEGMRTVLSTALRVMEVPGSRSGTLEKDIRGLADEYQL